MKPKKSLGQNFLKSSLAIKKIIEAGEIKPSDIILEIGPGKGALTERLLDCASKVIAVEKDYELFSLLQEKFAKQIAAGSLVLVHADILDLNVNILRNYKIIANIPYNITGAILKKFLTAEPQPERMILMLQKEVAQRILARDKKESILSISVKAYGEPKLIMKVPARYFSPSPKVDSAVIAITNISRKNFSPRGTLGGGNQVDEARFWQIVKAGFAHKRKKLSSNLKVYKGGSLITSLEELGNKRAEDLSLSDWISLAKL